MPATEQPPASAPPDKELQKRLIFAWLDALRSGEWRQAKEVLETPSGACCCLGVACRVAMNNGVPIRTKRVVDEEAIGFFYDDDGDYQELPASVRRLLGLKSSGGRYQEYPLRCLTTDNDEGVGFPRIADIIEAKAAVLFINGEEVAQWIAERKAGQS